MPLWLSRHRLFGFPAKPNIFVHHCFHGTAPQYLSELIPLYTTPVCALRSSSQSRLTIPGFHENTNKKCFGARFFRSSAPALWNSLPWSLKVDSSSASFKRQLKTHLFSKFLTHSPPAQFFFFEISYRFIWFTYFYIPPTLRHKHAVHGALLAQYKWTVIIIIVITVREVSQAEVVMTDWLCCKCCGFCLA